MAVSIGSSEPEVTPETGDPSTSWGGLSIASR